MIGLQGSLPTLAPTSTITAISAESATSGGNILADGGATVCFRGVCWSTSSNPTIALSTKTVDGTGRGSFTSSITGLTEITTYYVRSYATNAAGTAYGNEVVFTTPLDLTLQVTIGEQVWTTQNLNVSTYRDGTPIPKVEDAATWASLTYGAYCYYNNDSATYAAVYGKLYNWYAVADVVHGGLAPAGYHIPKDAEWITLETTLGANAGTQMKSTSGWLINDGTNSSGFSGFPGGQRDINGTSVFVENLGLWWSSSESDDTNAWVRALRYDYSNDLRGYNGKNGGLSVRCIKD